MTTINYVVLERGYEYNDEIETDVSNYGESFGIPLKIFVDEKKALKLKHELEKKKFEGLDLGMYCYSLEDILKIKEEEFLAYFGLTESNLELPETLTEEQMNYIRDNVNLDFYDVVKVPNG